MNVSDFLEFESNMLPDTPGTKFKVSVSHRFGEVEPVYLLLPPDVDDELIALKSGEGTETVAQLLGSLPLRGNVYVAALVIDKEMTLEYSGPWAQPVRGIRVSPDNKETDCVVRLDTGYFTLELCRGTGEGTGSSKWGIRHFEANAEGIDLLASGNNAIGGFYGPFFTPENGLINPPEHTIAHVRPIAEGPVQHRYRLSGVVPAGLLPELRGKKFEVDFVFTMDCPWFARRYVVESFQTVINGRTVSDKITVGDEFEAGQGSVVFDRFEQYRSTIYREGDPYALRLADAVGVAMDGSEGKSQKFEAFRNALANDISGAHWDLYWRLFSFWEQALPEEEIQSHLARVQADAHRQADGPDRPWLATTEAVDVPATPDATIFAGPADKTAEYSTDSGYSMIWWTSKPSGAFQIVQRRPSGWVNWGTNGENECPELPVGVDIKTQYGPYGSEWQGRALVLEHSATVETQA